MKTIFCTALIFSISLLAFAETTDLDPCTLIAKDEMAKILGEIKEGPKAREGLMKEKGCEWTSMSGSWLTLGVGSSDGWGMKKMAANNPAEVKALGEEAFSDKRGTDAELLVRKGKLMLEVRTSSGADAARKVAEIAVKKLP
jgi:hypothetical protein